MERSMQYPVGLAHGDSRLHEKVKLIGQVPYSVGGPRPGAVAKTLEFDVLNIRFN